MTRCSIPCLTQRVWVVCTFLFFFFFFFNYSHSPVGRLRYRGSRAAEKCYLKFDFCSFFLLQASSELNTKKNRSFTPYMKKKPCCQRGHRFSRVQVQSHILESGVRSWGYFECIGLMFFCLAFVFCCFFFFNSSIEDIVMHRLISQCHSFWWYGWCCFSPL